MAAGKGAGRPERINAQFSLVPATDCIGAGRVEGWFTTPAYIAEGRGWGHVQSLCFEGDLFFHLQRSPWLRGVNFQKKDEVTFEVVEVNGRCEAVKLLLPTQVQEMEEKRQGGEATDPFMPSPKDCVGRRVRGCVRSHHLLVAKQNWGFVSSGEFSGQVFWHLTENPYMAEVDFDRGDAVEFDVCLDEQRGKEQVRAKNMRFMGKSEKPLVHPPVVSERKKQKREQWLKNWSAAPPPDWDCPFCGWSNFGRNKSCNNRNAPNCSGQRPPREEWPSVANVPASRVAEDDAAAQRALTQQAVGAQAWGAEAPIPASWQQRDQQWRSPEQQWPAPEQQQCAQQWQPPEQQQWQPPEQWQLPQQQWQPPEKQRPPEQQWQTTEKEWWSPQQQWRPPEQQQQWQPPPAAPAQPGDESGASTLGLCLSAFGDLAAANATARLPALLAEVNQLLGGDRGAKQSFAAEAARHPWLRSQHLEARYQPGRNLVAVAPVWQEGWARPAEGDRKRRLEME